MPRLLVIGSGPTGVACAHALVARGFHPLVLDAGRRLEPEERVLDARKLEQSFPVDVDRLPLKPAFGSLFAYAPEAVRTERVEVVPSHALGGLSNVWGAAILPYCRRDLADWPFGLDELEPYYRSTFESMPLAGERDELEEEFPLYGNAVPLEPTAQIAALLARLRSRSAELRRAGVLAGRSRLAVSPATCEYVGLCMYGCPHDAIYNSAHALGRLGTDYRVGVAERVEEHAGSVRVRLAGGETIKADRVFVACGALESTRLVLRSIEAYERRAPLLESAYFTVPLLWRTVQAPRVGRGMAGNTLAQIFLELDRAHVQLYGYNDLMLRAAAARLRLPERAVRPLVGRLLYAQGYLHSCESPQMAIELARDGILSISAGDGASAARAITGLVERLGSLQRVTGLRPLGRMLQIWPQGKGFHVGGSLPMRERPGDLETDVLGRPPAFTRVHLVDASVFPSIPPRTITLSAMANAQRIAARHDEA